MRHTYSVLPTLRKEKKKNNRVLLMLRITINGKRAEISVQRKIDPDRWESKSNRMKGSKEDAKEVNALIDVLSLKLNRIHNALVERDEMATAKKIKNIFLGKDEDEKTLFEVSEIQLSYKSKVKASLRPKISSFPDAENISQAVLG